MTDESSLVPADIPPLRGCVDGINIKLVKCGDLREGLKMVHIARACGLKIMLGCMIESSVLISAAVHSGRDARARIESVVRDARSDAFSAEDLSRRLAHFLLENETLVPAAARALADGDVDAFGRAADESQRGAEDLLQNQVPETVRLSQMARELGAVASSAFGAGFGGSVWALVRASDAAAFPAGWRTRYQAVAPPRALARSSFFLTAPGPPATPL